MTDKTTGTLYWELQPQSLSLDAFEYVGVVMLRRRVLAAIANHPGIARSELRMAFPEVPPERLQKIVDELTRHRAVERCGHALLRIPEPDSPDAPKSGARYELSGFIQPPSLDRLMARK